MRRGPSAIQKARLSDKEGAAADRAVTATMLGDLTELGEEIGLEIKLVDAGCAGHEQSVEACRGD